MPAVSGSSRAVGTPWVIERGVLVPAPESGSGSGYEQVAHAAAGGFGHRVRDVAVRGDDELRQSVPRIHQRRAPTVEVTSRREDNGMAPAGIGYRP